MVDSKTSLAGACEGKWIMIWKALGLSLLHSSGLLNDELFPGENKIRRVEQRGRKPMKSRAEQDCQESPSATGTNVLMP